MGETHAVSFIDILLQYLSIDAVGAQDLSVGREICVVSIPTTSIRKKYPSRNTTTDHNPCY